MMKIVKLIMDVEADRLISAVSFFAESNWCLDRHQSSELFLCIIHVFYEDVGIRSETDGHPGVRSGG